MRLRLVIVISFLVLSGWLAPAALSGQTPPPEPPPAPPAPATAPQPPEPPAPPRAPVRPRRAAEAPRIPAEPSKGVNIRIDATVSESRGTEVIAKKILSVTVVDGENGSVRSTILVPLQQKGTAGFSYEPLPLNMDARVLLRDDNRVRVALVLDYKGARLESAAGQEGPEAIDRGIRQAVTVLLEDGKPMLVAQSADAIGERRVTLEVKATVLK